MRRIPIELAALAGCALAAQAPAAGPSQRFSLQDALRAALANNLQVQIAQETRTAARSGVPIAQGAFDWSLLGSFNSACQDSAVTRSLYPTGPLARTESTAWTRSLGLGVQKPLEWGGALQLNYSASYASSSGGYRNPDSGLSLGSFATRYPYSGALSGTYAQNLLKGFGRAVNEVYVITARNGALAADHQFVLAVVNLVATTESQYWDLVYAAQNLENVKAALALAEEQLKDNQGKVQAGTLPGIEVISAQAAAAYRRQALILAQSQLRIANDTLLRTLDPNAGRTGRIEPTDAPDTPFDLPEEVAAERAAIEHRLELQVARLSRESQGALRRAAENRLLPQLNASLSYNALSDTHTALSPANGDLGGSTYPGYSVGLTFAFPLANRTAKGSLAQARANERSSELALRDLELGIRLQVRQAYENAEAARESVAAARQTRVFREEDLRTERRKFENGMSTTFLVLAKQNDLDSALTAELQARIAVAKSSTALAQATGQLLEARGFAWVQ